jgi:hypothetical protein
MKNAKGPRVNTEKKPVQLVSVEKKNAITHEHTKQVAVSEEEVAEARRWQSQ